MRVFRSYAGMGIKEPYLSLSNQRMYLLFHSWHFQHTDDQPPMANGHTLLWTAQGFIHLQT